MLWLTWPCSEMWVALGLFSLYDHANIFEKSLIEAILFSRAPLGNMKPRLWDKDVQAGVEVQAVWSDVSLCFAPINGLWWREFPVSGDSISGLGSSNPRGEATNSQPPSQGGLLEALQHIWLALWATETLCSDPEGLNNICKPTDVSWRGLNYHHRVVQRNNGKWVLKGGRATVKTKIPSSSRG